MFLISPLWYTCSTVLISFGCSGCKLVPFNNSNDESISTPGPYKSVNFRDSRRDNKRSRTRKYAQLEMCRTSGLDTKITDPSVEIDDTVRGDGDSTPGGLGTRVRGIASDILLPKDIERFCDPLTDVIFQFLLIDESTG